MRALALALVLSGCYPQIGPFPKLEHQDEIVNYIWYERYGMLVEPPQVEWIPQAKLDCGRVGPPETGYNVAFMADNTCVYGISYPYDYYTKVAYPDKFSFGDSALTHEFNHFRLEMKGVLYGDPDHKDPTFQQGGLVNQIQQEIRMRWN